MSESNGAKSVDVSDIERRSVIDVPDAPSSRSPVPSYDATTQWIWLISQFADELDQFGRAPSKIRDAQLRQYILMEPIFASALGVMCARNAGFSWKVDAPPRTAIQLQYLLDTANMGEGWHDLVIKTSIDLYTQDYGAFWEIVRKEDRANSPVIGINHLDAARCYHTGNKEAPVIYQDRLGKYHLLRRWNVLTLSDLPVPIEGMYGMQYCSLSRLLQGMRIQRNINIRKDEKTSGRDANSIHLVQGITTQQLTDAINTAKAQADVMGRSRFMSPIVAGSIDPKASIDVKTIELAGMPEDYDEKLNFDHYINLIALAFASDYQEFAPLPGGGLGTGAQSEMLHLKSHGKGPGHFMKIISHAINFRIFPENAKFWWDEQDLEAEMQLAEVKAVRAQTRAVRIASFEIDPVIARQIANDEGDLSDELLAMIGEEDITENAMVSDEVQAEYSATDQGKPQSIETAPPKGPARIPTISRPRPLGANKDKILQRGAKILDIFRDD